MTMTTLTPELFATAFVAAGLLLILMLGYWRDRQAVASSKTQYLAFHPTSLSQGKIHCCHCGSHQVQQHNNAGSCKRCNSMLWQN